MLSDECVRLDILATFHDNADSFPFPQGEGAAVFGAG